MLNPQLSDRGHLPKYLQEDELSSEFRDLISSLPIEKGWVATHLHQYQGFWHTTRQLRGVVACQKHFQAHDTDVLLVSFPKSGTTWLKAITFALMNRSLYPSHHERHPLLTENPHVLVPFLELDLYVENEAPDLNTSFASPRLFSTHLPLLSLPKSVKDSTSKVVYLSRNPKDTFVSLWHFTNKLRPKKKGCNSLEESFDKFCKGISIYGPFWDHVLSYWNEAMENRNRIFFLKFEEMKEQPTLQLKKLAEFLGCPLTLEEETRGVPDNILRLCSFENLSNLEVNKNGKLASGEEHKAFFRRGEVADWKNYLTREMAERIDKITKDKLVDSELKF